MGPSRPSVAITFTVKQTETKPSSNAVLTRKCLVCNINSSVQNGKSGWGREHEGRSAEVREGTVGWKSGLKPSGYSLSIVQKNLK